MGKDKGNVALMFYVSSELRDAFYVLKNITHEEMQKKLTTALQIFVYKNRKEIIKSILEKGDKDRKELTTLKDELEVKHKLLDKEYNRLKFTFDLSVQEDKEKHDTLQSELFDTKNKLRLSSVALSRLEVTLYEDKKALETIEILSKRFVE